MKSSCMSYIKFLLLSVHLSKRYNLKYQIRLYEDLLDTYCHKNGITLNENIISVYNYICYDNLENLYEESKEICKNKESPNLFKYIYLYCCYRLHKENGRTLVLMFLDEDFLIHISLGSSYDTYKLKSLEIYERNLYNVNAIPGYSAGYYLLGKIYERSFKNMSINNMEEKERLLNLSFHFYYLSFSSCPFLISAYKKLTLLYHRYYCDAYVNNVKKLWRLYNYWTHVYMKWKYGNIKKEDEEEVNERNNEKTKKCIVQLLWDQKGYRSGKNDRRSIPLKTAFFILSLIDKESLNSFFQRYMEWIQDSQEERTQRIYSKLSSSIIHDLHSLGMIYYHFYCNCVRDALEILNQWKNVPVLSIPILYFKASCFFHMRNYKRALFYFRKIQELDSGYTKHLAFLSSCLLHMGKSNQIEYLLYVYPKSKINEHFLCLLGNYYSLKEKSHKTLDFFKKSIELNALYEYPYIPYINELIKVENCKKAISLITKYLDIYPSNYKTHVMLSYILFQDGSRELSNVHLTISLLMNPYESLLFLYQSIWYAYYEKYETSCLCLEEAKQQNFEHRDLYLLQGVIYLKMKRTLDALQSFTKAQMRNTNDFYLLTLVALALVMEKKFEKAKVIIQNMILKNIHMMYKNILDEIYSACNKKVPPSIDILNQIEYVYKQKYRIEKVMNDSNVL